MGVGNSSHAKLEEALAGSTLPQSERVVSLENIGNSCFAGAVLQALYWDTGLRAALLNECGEAASDGGDGTVAGHSGTVMLATAELFRTMSTAKKRIASVAPKAFFESLREANAMYREQEGMHHDAHELLNYLLNEFAETLEARERSGGDKDGDGSRRSKAALHTSRVGGTEVHRQFQGVMATETKCLGCEGVTTRRETFLDLGLDVPPRDSTLSELMERFGAPETLRSGEKYWCDRCRCLQEATKRARILELPQSTLVLHVKRFKFDESVGAHRKLCSKVVVPMFLRIELGGQMGGIRANDGCGEDGNGCDSNADGGDTFELRAVVMHIGKTPNQGHYITAAKAADGLWLLFDDEDVRRVDETWLRYSYGGSSTTSCCGYILFYGRRQRSEVEKQQLQTTYKPDEEMNA